MRTRDGRRLAYLAWPPASGQEPRAIVMILHGVQSHAGWYHGLGRRLAAQGFLAFFYDRRGSGANPEARGHARSSRQLLSDLRTAIEQAQSLARGPGAGRRPLVLAGISWGGKVVVAGAAQNRKAVDGLALVCPGLAPRVGVSLRERLTVALALLTRRADRVRLPIPLADPALFTNDPDAQDFIAGDPLSLRDATAGLLATSFFLDRRASRAPRRVKCPTLLMLAGQDRIINNDHTRHYMARLATERKRVVEYASAHHTLEFEPDPAEYAADLGRWIDAEVLGIADAARS